MPTWFDRLNLTKRWGSSATLAEPSDTQAQTGFSFLGQAPPSTGLHDALFQYKDDADNYLFGLLKNTILAGGVTPAFNDVTSLTTALRAMFGANFTAIGFTSNFTVPAGVTRIKATVIGGGGAGGNSSAAAAGNVSLAPGGNSGSIGIGVFSVTPGATIACTIGAGAAAGSNGIGGTSSFGAFLSAPGGHGPGATVPANPPPLTQANNVALTSIAVGVGALCLYERAGFASLGFSTTNFVSGGGADSTFGTGGKPVITLTGAGNAALGWGAGGGGAATGPGGAAQNGGAGAPGIVVLEY